MEVLRRVHRGAFAAPSLSSSIERLSDGRERSLLTDLVYGTLRHEILLDACLAPRLSAPDRLPEFVRDALRLATFELLVRGTPRHAAVDQWVGLVKLAHPRLAGLANAVLRRVEIPPDLAAAESSALPGWLWREFAALLAQDALASAQGMLQPEPLWLSALHPGAAVTLSADGCDVSEGPVAGSLAVRCPGPVASTDAFREGLVQPQNPASRLPVSALGSVAGERVLDLASGNGVKSAQLAAAGALVRAVEVDAKKVARARRNLARLGLEVQHVTADLREPVPDLAPAPKVLLDAPCSGTGTLRGHPEIKLRLSAEDVKRLADLQRELLETAAALVTPGGILVYSVCALTPAEGPGQIDDFLADHPDFFAEDVTLRSDAAEDGRAGLGPSTIAAGKGRVVLPLAGLDGFFIARLRRRE